MDDLGSYRIPREAELGREVRLESRRAVNRTTLFAVGGIFALCVCLCVGIAGLAMATGNNPLGGITINLFDEPTAAAPTRATARGTPTLVPFARSARSDNGLRVTVTAFQRPLPTEDVQIPDGQELALVTVRIDNSRTTGAPLKYSPEDFALVSEEGDHFPVNIGGITTGENLAAGEVAPGQNLKGDLIFFVYTDAPELHLQWTSADGKTRLFRLTR